MEGTETNVDPDEVLNAAARLAALAGERATTVVELVEQIRTFEVRAAAGNDSPGNEFLSSYHGTDGSGVDGILDGGEAACESAHSLAEGTGLGVIETELQDEEDAGRIRDLHEELSAHGAVPSLLQDQGTLDQVAELQALMQDPRAATLLGEGDAAEVGAFLEDVERLAE